jgi:DNA-binding transcriptional MerR regulator
MRIGELATQAGVSAKTVRYYESIGLVPEPTRTPSGYRDYGPDALDRLRFIRDAQASGLRLDEIRSVLELKDSGRGSCEHTLALLRAHLEEIDAQIARLVVARDQLTSLADRAAGLDRAGCTDPNRCQVISGSHVGAVRVASAAPGGLDLPVDGRV